MSIELTFKFDEDLPSGAEIKRAVGRAVSELIDEADKDFDIITRFDDNPANFTKSGSGLRQEIGTSDPYFVRRNDGTPATHIVAKNAKALRFQENYTARTTPNVITSQSGGASGEYVFRKSVNHPGIEARNHDEAVADHLEELAEDIVCDHLQRLFA